MTSRRALVVDDSRSARAFLTRILERYELAVDGVESAEQAIEYLTRQRPDVIFMDHLMPGMDGFQAVQAIKNNPLTATIPIMMYTSQEGELYLSQARALGAIGVLPKQTKHTDVSKALDQLNLIIATPHATGTHAVVPEAVTTASSLGDTTTTVEVPAPPPPREAPFVERRGKNRPNLPALAPELRSVVEAMVSHHMRDLQRFVSESLETQADRVVGDVRLLLKDQPPPPLMSPLPPPEPHASGGVWLGLAGIVVACLVGWQWQQQRVDSAALAAQLEMSQQQLNAAHEQLQTLQASGGASGAADSNEAAAAQEAANITIEPVPYGETPLAGSRLERIQSLLARLNSQGFKGVVEIRSIPGRFCMVTGPAATPVLASDSMPFSRCDQVGNPREDNGSASQRQSVAFANMVATARENGNGKLDIQIGAGTADETITPYPPVSDGLTAGDWNRVGAANNRVEIHWQAAR
jgi:CheY-like chemotaxis protein